MPMRYNVLFKITIEMSMHGKCQIVKKLVMKLYWCAARERYIWRTYNHNSNENSRYCIASGWIYSQEWNGKNYHHTCFSCNNMKKHFSVMWMQMCAYWNCNNTVENLISGMEHSSSYHSKWWGHHYFHHRYGYCSKWIGRPYDGGCLLIYSMIPCVKLVLFAQNNFFSFLTLHACT